MQTKVELWKCLNEKVLHSTRVFDLIVRRMQSPDGSFEDDFFALVSPDWVNIIPLTEKNEVVLVKQFRHGTQEISLELPGGIVSANDSNHSRSALREMEEETGYTTAEIHSLGFVHPNPAIMGNRCHFFLGTGVTKTSEQKLDPAEDIAVSLVALDDIPTLINSHQITHSLTLNAFLMYFLIAEQKSY